MKIDKSWPTVNVDHDSLERRLVAVSATEFRNLYFCQPVDKSLYAVRLRHDHTPSATTEIVDWKHLLEKVQPITAEGLHELHKLKPGQLAHTEQYTINRVE